MPDTPEKKVSFKDTLNLPRTDFPIRSNPKSDDPAMIKRWEKEQLFEKTFNANKGQPKYILHDGPPYANGHIHLGTAFNKISKDIITKSRRMFGQHVPVTPGWDCHGLPIELKVATENPGLSREKLITACREYAQKWVDVQREEFKNLGVLMDWEHPYLTMNYGYESSELRAFGRLVAQGYIDRKNRTVSWCASCQTVLASAEIEYHDRKDPSVFVRFPIDKYALRTLWPALVEKEVSVLVWTTTPWTLPLNRAVLIKPGTKYTLLDINGHYVLVGSALADKLVETFGVEKKVVDEMTSEEILNLVSHVNHPLLEGMQVPLIADDSVAVDEGTAFVHCAPGAGPIDYEIGVRNNLEIFSPVTPDGKYSAHIQPQELMGMSVADGQIWVIKKLVENGRMLHKSSIRHSYPHCWRCRNGLIFRATKQWFCDLAKHDLKKKALEATETIEAIPAKSINRLRATLEGRLEWCLSRQRTWGVPIPALICTHCDEAYTSKDLIDDVATHVADEGIEYWERVEVEEVTPPEMKCATCKGTTFRKEKDILDVWFDAGVSHYAVLRDNPELAYPADLYFEGSDQHRGWFQSSLLTSIALEDSPSMKAIGTHGYVVDAQGKKMSKSLGNVVTPPEIIEKLGTDGLRLWASSSDYGSEIIVSDVVLRNVQEVFRRIRNTARFLLSNLYDFDIDKDGIPLAEMKAIDLRAMHELLTFNCEILQHYAALDFTTVYHLFGEYTATNLSAFYLDIVKDRLYVAQADGKERRSAQTVCYYILDVLTRLMAPILSFTAEQLSDLYQKNKTESIHLQKFAALPDVFEHFAQDLKSVFDFYSPQSPGGPQKILKSLEAAQKMSTDAERWTLLKNIRGAILKAIEKQREKGVIKHSLEAEVTAYFDPKASYAKTLHDFFAELKERGENPEDFFKEFAIVSCFDIVKEKGKCDRSEILDMFLAVTPARGVKCPRCWQWEETDNPDGLCGRCQKVVNKLRNPQKEPNP